MNIEQNKGQSYMFPVCKVQKAPHLARSILVVDVWGHTLQTMTPVYTIMTIHVIKGYSDAPIINHAICTHTAMSQINMING